MDKKIAGLLGAVAALGTLGTARAAPMPVQGAALQANSFAELLEPVPNAAEVLRTIDEQAPEATDGNIQLAWYHHHHHHHHHGYWRRAPRIVVVPPRYHRRYYHHHHHHHHHMYRRY